MMLPVLIAADLHLTASPSDAYRWSILDWMWEQIEVEGLKTILILGDLTDAKDYHPSELANKLVAGVSRLASKCKVVILLGNHDYLKKGQGFFSFLNCIPNVQFITEPTEDLEPGISCMLLPHTRTPAKDWAGMDFGQHYQYVFMHQTVGGAVASNGQEMNGEDVPPFPPGPKVMSGDIHVPQIIKGVEYIGSPYHVHFGDDFAPRCVLIDRRYKHHDLTFKTPRRVSLKLSSLKELKRRVTALDPGDMVKLTLELPRSEIVGWSALRREARLVLDQAELKVESLRLSIARSERRLDVKPDRRVLSDEQVIERFVLRDELGADALELGLELLQ